MEAVTIIVAIPSVMTVAIVAIPSATVVVSLAIPSATTRVLMREKLYTRVQVHQAQNLGEKVKATMAVIVAKIVVLT